MNSLASMRRHLGFSKEDERLLSRLWPAVAERRERLLDGFYGTVVAASGEQGIRTDVARVQRMRVSMEDWLESLFTGPYDAAYEARRARIGQAHFAAGLPWGVMFAAMAVLKESLCDIADEVCDRAQVRPTSRAIDRIATLDLAILSASYAASQERSARTTLEHLIVANLPGVILVLDEHDRVAVATARSNALIGGASAVGRRVDEVVPPDVVQACDLLDLIARARAVNRPVEISRVDVGPMDDPRVVEVRVVPLESPWAAAIVHIDDVTDAVRLEACAREHEALAQLGALSAAVAHELRNPLAGISGAMQVLVRGFDDDDRRKGVLLKVNEQVRRVDALVTDLLAFARPMPAELHRIDLSEVVEREVAALRLRAPRCEVVVHGQGCAMGDEVLLHHVVSALLDNAQHAVSDVADGLVDVEVSEGRIAVRDNGPGLSPTATSRLFQPFHTTKTQGTGLGLAIARRSARSMGGDVVMAPHRSRGAAFEVVLLAVDAPDASA